MKPKEKQRKIEKEQLKGEFLMTQNLGAKGFRAEIFVLRERRRTSVR